MEPSGIVDATLRIIIILSLLGWIVFEGLSLRTPDPATMVALWESPIWRVSLLVIVWLGAEWCPRVGILTALATTLYIANMMQVGKGL